MSSRNRGRASHNNQDADEERRLWSEIKGRAKDVDAMVSRSNTIGAEITEVEAQQAALIDAGKDSSAQLDDRLEKLYRENVKICEDVQHIIEGKSNDMNLLDSIKILAGLREASEESAAAALHVGTSQGRERGSAGGGRSGKAKRTIVGAKSGGPVAAVEEGEEVGSSAAPSPRISISAAAGRLTKEGKTSRAGSIPATREASVKIEDGAESVASSNDAPPSTSTPTTSAANASASKTAVSSMRPSNRLVLKMGEVVFCRHSQQSASKSSADLPEGEGILCRVTAVIGEGKQRRYEVQDADTSGEAPPPQRASVSQLIQIPQTNRGLSDLPKGKSVLAQYPDTTTFYKAEVSEGWKAGATGNEPVRLNFADDDQTKEVERKFVLSER